MKVASIFLTVDGEVSHHGPWQWSVFLRLGGCNLRCWKSSGFCDAPHTLDMKFPYPELTVNEVVHDLLQHGDIRRCTITGGEPLLQKEEVIHVARLLDEKLWDVTLETSGSIPFTRAELQDITSIIMDLKPPSTEMEKKNELGNLEELDCFDYVKVVLENRADYDWAVHLLHTYPTEARIAFGVRWGYLELRQVADWLRADKLFDIQLNIQSHKYIWEGSHPVPVEKLNQVDFVDMVNREH